MEWTFSSHWSPEHQSGRKIECLAPRSWDLTTFSLSDISREVSSGTCGFIDTRGCHSLHNRDSASTHRWRAYEILSSLYHKWLKGHRTAPDFRNQVRELGPMVVQRRRICAAY
ncbi:hypothetical protein Vi05172_g96 [Venturia inaequalis]|nr:hypothetical protein Vi05172_g96 [Venturia inaequalis]